jgi:hypothetical protein
MEQPAQILPDYASKAFNRVRESVRRSSHVFDGLNGRQLPTLHEIRALSSHLYAKAGFDVGAVQDLMAHTDPDMTRAYQKGHARKVLRVDMLLPFSVDGADDGVREETASYRVARHPSTEKKYSQNFLKAIGFSIQPIEF